MGYQSVLIDALWDKQIGRKGIEKLAEYAKAKESPFTYGITPMAIGMMHLKVREVS